MSTRGGRVPGSEGYNDSDIRALLACVAEVRPTGKREWLRVLKLYRKKYAEPQMRSQRDVNSIKSKFRQILNLKTKATPGGAIGGKPHAMATEAHKIQLEIQMRQHAAMAEGRHIGADDGSDITDSDAEISMNTAAPAVHAPAVPAAPQHSTITAAATPLPLGGPLFPVESTSAIDNAVTTIRASPSRPPPVPIASQPAMTTSAFPLATSTAPSVRKSPSPLRRIAAAPPPQPAPAPPPPVAPAATATPEPLPARALAPAVPIAEAAAPTADDSALLATRFAALEQHNYALTAQLHAIHDAATHQLRARVATLEQQNSALTARLHTVTDNGDALRTANYDLREQVLQLRTALARVETENHDLRVRSNVAMEQQ